MIGKAKSLQVSQDVLDLIIDKYNNKMDGYIDTFNNCRETGFVLKLISINDIRFKDQFVVWIHEHRNSDDIVVRYANTFEDCNINNMFSDKVYKEQSESFKVEDYEGAVKYIIDIAEKTIELENKKEEKIKPRCALIRQDVNIFNLMGIASRALKQNNMREEVTEMCNRITSSGSYEEALSIIDEYVEITDEAGLEDEEWE